MRYTISRPDGTVIGGNHTSPLGALRDARKLCWDHAGPLVISEYPNRTAKTGRTVMHVSPQIETDWTGRPLDFWGDGKPMI